MNLVSMNIQILKQLNRKFIWARLSSLDYLGLTSDLHMHFLKDPKILDWTQW